MKRLGAVLYNDFELLDAYGPLEMFGCLSEQVEIVVIAEEKGPVKSSGGPQTLAEFSFDDAPDLDLILLPGGFGTIPELENDAMLGFLRERCPSSLRDHHERLLRFCSAGEGRSARWAQGDLEQNVLLACQHPERRGGLAGSRPLGGCGSLRHLIGCLGRNRHGARRDCPALWCGSRRVRGAIHRISVAHGRGR